MLTLIVKIKNIVQRKEVFIMAITLLRNRTPFEGFTSWFDTIDTFFDTGFGELPELKWRPAIDVEEKDGTYLLRADLPGMKKKDIHIELHNGYLTLRGERRSEHEEEEDTYRRVERTYGSFERTFRVPEGVTHKDIHAKYKDGVLELTVPTPKVEKPKTVELKIE
jgi:HSP20 family protein